MSPVVCLAVRSRLLGVGSLGLRDRTQFVSRNIDWLGHLASPTPLYCSLCTGSALNFIRK